MSHSIQQYILAKLQQRNSADNFRLLSSSTGLIDFTSNDYLGFARNEILQQKIQEELTKLGAQQYGSTGSRLLSGNSIYAETLEKQIAQFHGSEDALLFNSGFDANYGLLSTLPYKGDTIIYDELVHASMHDGIRNSKASSVSFLHNNIHDLATKLSSATGLKYVVVESVYSMDGDLAPLQQIADLCKQYDAGLIVDEAHATGVFGKNGEGLLTAATPALARVHTFGKALGAHGAVVLCSTALKQFLVNYCRPFIFSTALPLHALAAVKCGYEYLSSANRERQKLFSLIKLLKESLAAGKNFGLILSNSQIQSIIVAGNSRVKLFAQKLRAEGFDVRPILPPTVPKGKERIRICLHSFNTETEVIKLAQAINSL